MMGLSRLTREEVSYLAVRSLGMDPELVGLTSAEMLTESLLRAASVMCPTTPARLIRSVLEALQPLSGPVEPPPRDVVADLLDQLIASGDLLELRREADGRSTRLLYLGPPSYVECHPGAYRLLGVRPFGASIVGPDLADSIDREGFTRTLMVPVDGADKRLAFAGLHRIEPKKWVSSPRREEAGGLVARLTSLVDKAGASGEIEGLQILDPNSGVRYYRGRWRQAGPADTGIFVARRPQAFGSDSWCLLRLNHGMPQRFIEFPLDDPVLPARDEAWRTQMAIDADRGSPQVFSTQPADGGNAAIVKFFGPVPGFAQRYLELIGLALPEATGALFAFRVPTPAMPGLENLLSTLLWMKPVSTEGTG